MEDGIQVNLNKHTKRLYILFSFASIGEASRYERKHIPGGTVLLH
jgi:hypothetical protein